MLRQITPAHKNFSAKWNFEEGEIECITLGCKSIDLLTTGIASRIVKRLPGTGKILLKNSYKIELTAEEEKLFKQASEIAVKEMRLEGDICIYIQYDYRFSDDEKEGRMQEALSSFYHNKIIDDKFNGKADDWNAL